MVYKRVDSILYLTPKLLYIVVNIEYFMFYSFRQLFLVNKKISQTAVTFTFMVMQLTTFFSNMGIAYFADAIQKPKLVLTGCLLISAILFQTLFLNLPTLLCCLCFIMYSAFILSTIPLLDRIVLDYLQKVMNAPSSMYGRQRMFGTFTYLAVNYFTEILVYGMGGSSSKQEDPKFSRLQIPYLLFAALAAGAVYTLGPQDRRRETGAEASRTRERPQISKVLKNKAYMFFLLIILMNGATRGVLTVYLSAYYKNVIKLSDSTSEKTGGLWGWISSLIYSNPISTCSAFGVMLEILIFFCSLPIQRALGLYWAFLISQVSQAMRFFFYTTITKDTSYKFERCCLIELLKGVNFGLTHLSGVQLAVKLVPSNLKSTSQMIYAGTFVCMGGMLGSLLGYFYKIQSEEDIKDVVTMFWVGCAVSFIGAVLVFVKYGMMEGKLWGREEENLPQQVPSAQSSTATLKQEAK